MNIWKASTVGLVVALGVVAGSDAFHSANASSAGAVSPSSVGYDWGAEQPHMERALNDLRGARHSLEVASENKGGWRMLALKHTDEAIAEVVRGIEYGKNHPRD
jgi:hypothetical protein